MERNRVSWLAWGAAAFLFAGCAPARNGGGPPPACVALAGDPRGEHPLREVARRQGTVPVLVRLEVETHPEATLEEAEAEAQRRRIAAAQDEVLGLLEGSGSRPRTRYRRFPLLSLLVTEEGLCRLLTSPRVLQVEEDGVARPGG